MVFDHHNDRWLNANFLLGFLPGPAYCAFEASE